MKNFEFNYRMLHRLATDCEYYLGFGGRDEQVLWAKSVERQIAKMKQLWLELPEDKKPIDLSWDKIRTFELAMAQ
ncbi:hypothetical protein NHG29_03240 [Aerococcaceae bacterium NML160702]|nr:hypothetical protein [Aerococcaceae bacterium NML160702]